MKKTWKIRKDKEGVSPVIATILMVAITVVLAAVLYVMVINMGGGRPPVTPLGLVQQSRDQTSVGILIAEAPNDAKVTGTQISISHNGVPTPITNATLYSGAADIAAWYSPISGWSYGSGYSADTLDFTAGMTLIINTGSISNGDFITISSLEEFFLTTSINVN